MYFFPRFPCVRRYRVGTSDFFAVRISRSDLPNRRKIITLHLNQGRIRLEIHSFAMINTAKKVKELMNEYDSELIEGVQCAIQQYVK